MYNKIILKNMLKRNKINKQILYIRFNLFKQFLAMVIDQNLGKFTLCNFCTFIFSIIFINKLKCQTQKHYRDKLKNILNEQFSYFYKINALYHLQYL